MSDDDARQPLPPWTVWAAVIALSGSSGLGSFYGTRSTDGDLGERIARLESNLANNHAAITDVRGSVRELQQQRVECDSRTANLRWRVEQCERLLNDGSQ